MSSAAQLHAQALQQYRAGEHGQAERLCWEILRLEPLHAEAIYLLGVLALEAGQAARALLHFHHATLLQPGHAPFHHALGEAHRARGDRAEAAACFREALRLDAGLASVHHSLGVTLSEQGELDQAVASFRQCLSLQPDQPRAHTNLGQALHRKGDLAAAAVCFREAIRLKPDYAIPHNNLGALLHEQGKYGEAVVALRQALALQPNYPEAHCNLGNVLRAQGDARAIGRYQEAVRLRPDYLKAHCYLGTALAAQGRTDEASACLQTALRLQPDHLEALEQLGHVLLQQARWDDARPVFERLLALQPDHAEAFACLVRLRELLCDWRTRSADFDRLRRDAEQRLSAGRRPAITPFNTMTLPWPPALHLAVARSFSEDLLRQLGDLPASLRFTYPRSRPARLRIGYLAGNFHDNALMHLMQGLFGQHDRSAFEIFVYSYGPEDNSSYRQCLRRDCDHFLNLAGVSSADSARRIHDDGIHILVDLMGHTGGTREEIVALRPAPIQISYLGFAGSMGAPFLDYLIGDRTVTPPERAADFSERLILMPHCYQVNDSEQEIDAGPVCRAEYGLPEGAVVFASFNNSYKFEPHTFGIWMRILGQVPDSVLWLYSSGATMEGNLRREAEARGIAAERLVFAPHRPKSKHLARLRLADLFLDTHYVNAHTGASDALWAGLPVLTWPGEIFASRVAASLLANVGLPELIAADEEAYERRAVELGRDPGELRRLRQRLAAQRTSWPLFDTARFTRNLEQAYRAAWDIYAAGHPPA
jgi:predicted O-linked N-acetylglucosamine transferase (SPINDLY family)